jgi:2-(1,2-epoxy-1,2-dihydrophenyl)acetyl-CoA isomerase
VALRRPAVTRALRLGLLQMLHDVAAREPIGAVVITGTARIFCAGQDLDEHAAALAERPQTATASLDSEYTPLIELLADYPKPVVAAVNGVCAGGGLGLALACDVRVAATSARFVPAFVGIGLAPDCGVSATLGRAVGWARAREILLANRTVTAEEALAWGLVGSVVPDDDIRRAAVELAGRLAGAHTAVRATKQLLAAAETDAGLTAALHREAAVQAGLAALPEHAAGVHAVRNRLQDANRAPG